MNEKKKGDDNNSALKGEMGRKNAMGCLILIVFFGTFLIIDYIENVILSYFLYPLGIGLFLWLIFKMIDLNRK